MSQSPVPKDMFNIPEGTPVEQLPHYGAQFAIQAIMMSLGSRDIEPGHTAVSTELLMQSLAMAMAMLVSADERFATPRDVRIEAENWGKITAGFARILRESNDQTGTDLLQILGLKQRDFPIN